MKSYILLVLSAILLLSCSCAKGNKSTEKKTETVKIIHEVIDEAPAEETQGIGALKPLTQYALVDTSETGPFFRKSLGTVIKNIGFTVSKNNRPASMDPMDRFKELSAYRQNGNGTTTVELFTGEDDLCIINFANQAELNEFVNSMRAANYSYDGRIYSHPQNDMLKICAKVEGLKVTLICPYETLPTNF